MRKWFLNSKSFFVLGLILCQSCSLNEPQASELSLPPAQLVPTYNHSGCDPKDYDYSCMEDGTTDLSDEVIGIFSDARDALLEGADPISAERQDEYGEEGKEEVEREYRILRDHPKQALLHGLMRKLLKFRLEESGIGYNIYVISADMVNAFTIGGEIFVTEDLLDAVESIDELACVVGHEIGHNELGHIEKKLQELEVAQGIFGDELGGQLASLAGFLTISFNQRNEVGADMYGLDLALSAGYDPCRGIDFWERIQKDEAEANELDNLGRSHPYSSKRINCYRHHLEHEHRMICP